MPKISVPSLDRGKSVDVESIEGVMAQGEVDACSNCPS